MLPSQDPIVKDQGLVLRWFPVTDTSRIVVWFTREHGKISTLIRGSQRSKSWMLGQYDLFYTCEVLFYMRAKEDLHILRECSPTHIRSDFRREWRSCAGASFIVDLLYRISPSLAPEPRLFTLSSELLDLLNRTPASPLHLFWFELQVYRAMGVSPNLENPHDTPVWFDPRSGTLVAHALTDRFREHPPASEGAIAMMRNLLETRDPERLLRLRPLPGQVQEIARHLRHFSQWHLDLDLTSRNHALRWVTAPHGMA